MKFSNNLEIGTYRIDLNENLNKVSTLFVHAFSVHFYLRDKRAKQNTSIVAVVRMGEERAKFSTKIQVQPHLWNKKDERLKPINCICIEQNKRINECRCHIEELCLSLRCINEIKAHFDDMTKTKSEKKQTDINVERILREAFRLYYIELKAKRKIAESTINNSQKQLSKLCQLINEMGKNNSRTFLANGYSQLKDFVIEYYEGYTSGANQKLELFARLLNHIRSKQNYIQYHIEPINHIKISSQQTFKDALTDDEIKALENVKLDNENENNARYLFLIECECGSRNSDISQVVSLVKGLEIGSVKAYKETKEGRTAVAVNTEKLQLYISRLTHKHNKMDCAYIDMLLKKVAKKAELNRIIPTMNNKPLHECISTHFGRHTFITNMRRKGYTEEDVVKFTGHATSEMVRKVYAHLSNEDHENEARHIITKVEHKQLQQQPTAPTAKPQRFPTSVAEAKEVLQFLGIETTSDDIGVLLGTIIIHERYILDLCRNKIDIETIKDLFNTSISLDERCKALQILVDGLRS